MKQTKNLNNRNPYLSFEYVHALQKAERASKKRIQALINMGRLKKDSRRFNYWFNQYLRWDDTTKPKQDLYFLKGFICS